MVDRYSLTWGDYGTSLVSAVQLLRCHGDLVDVTLAAGGRSFSAHKIVLCAASPYLLDLLKNTTCKHPIVMLAGVNANDLEALLEFVYRGEVSVDHSQLPSLLQAAHCLNIQGLAPQTVTHKDDTTTAYTSIQIHPSLVQQDVKTHILDVGNNCTEEMITTIQTPSHQQMETQVVEEVIHQDPLDSEDVTKDVINQFLPQRKRKPRAKRPNPSKMIKLEQSPSSSNMMTTTTTIIGSAQNQSQDSIVETLAEMEDTENENEMEVKPEDQELNKALMTPSSKSDKASKSKAKSQSEQPATCPICSAVIRQSRNLRRHLELRHFKKRTPKKESGSANTSTEQIITDSANGNQTITVTMAPNSDQQTITVNGQQQQQHVLTQHENPDGTTSLSITQVPGLQGHQIIGSLNNATIIRTDDGQQLDGNLITTHEASLRPHTELFRVGTTVYTIEERRPDPNRMS